MSSLNSDSIFSSISWDFVLISSWFCVWYCSRRFLRHLPTNSLPFCVRWCVIFLTAIDLHFLLITLLIILFTFGFRTFYFLHSSIKSFISWVIHICFYLFIFKIFFCLDIEIYSLNHTPCFFPPHIFLRFIFLSSDRHLLKIFLELHNTNCLHVIHYLFFYLFKIFLSQYQLNIPQI